MPEPETPAPARRRHLMTQLGRPLLNSVPTLLGVIVGSLAGHFAEINRIDFEREDRFRQEQLERVAKLAHSMNALYSTARDTLNSAASGKHHLCGFAKEFGPLENKLIAKGVLHSKFFGDRTDHPVQEYEASLKHEIESGGPEKEDANNLLQLLGGYSEVIGNILDKSNAFGAQKDTVNNDVIFDVLVYFPKEQKAVLEIANAYDGIVAAATAQTLSQETMCSATVAPLESKLDKVHVKSVSLTINLARSLAPKMVREQEP